MKKILSAGLLFCSLLAATSGQRHLTAHTFAYDSTLNVTGQLEDLAWLTGRWSGEGFGGWLEEIWSPPAGGAMVATFRMLSEGQPVFYEICLIAEENKTLVYKVKHFNPDLKGWEEKEEYVTFPLVKMEANAVYFNGLTMIEYGGTCDIYLAMKQKDGSYEEEKLIYYKDEKFNENRKVFPKIHIPQEEENIARLKEINRDIWTPFAEAYAARDAGKYLALHTPDFIRANGGDWPGVKDLKTYGESVRQSFGYSLESGNGVEIAFRFFERAAGPETATERGIYRYTSLLPEGERQHFYGKFHVFHRKVDGQWKIAVDYDSNEDGSIGEKDFEAGWPPEVFTK